MSLENVEVPITGKITAVKVSVGSAIKEGDEICTLESMKMQNPVLSPVGGVVKEIKVSPGQTVKSGEILAIIEY